MKANLKSVTNVTVHLKFNSRKRIHENEISSDAIKLYSLSYYWFDPYTSIIGHRKKVLCGIFFGRHFKVCRKMTKYAKVSFTLYMLSFSRYTTSSFIKFIRGRTYSLPWLIIVLRYIALYPVGGGWTNTISFAFLSAWKTSNLISFKMG